MLCARNLLPSLPVWRWRYFFALPEPASGLRVTTMKAGQER